METKMKTLSLALFCASLPAIALAQVAQQGEVSQLIAKSTAVHSLMKSKDVSGLKTLLADDFQSVGSEGKLHSRSDLLGDVQDGTQRDFTLYDPRVFQVDSGTALVIYSLVVTMVEGDDLAPRYQKISDLWVRAGDDWRLKFEQSTPLRPID